MVLAPDPVEKLSPPSDTGESKLTEKFALDNVGSLFWSVLRWNQVDTAKSSYLIAVDSYEMFNKMMMDKSGNSRSQRLGIRQIHRE